MTQDHIMYAAGQSSFNRLRYTYRFNVHIAHLSPMAAAGRAQFLEIWCRDHCRGEWRVEQRYGSLAIGFDGDLDVVLFHLSDEYGRFAEKNGTVVERPICVV